MESVSEPFTKTLLFVAYIISLYLVVTVFKKDNIEPYDEGEKSNQSTLK